MKITNKTLRLLLTIGKYLITAALGALGGEILL